MRIVALVVALGVVHASLTAAEPKTLPYGAFGFTQALTLPGTPEQIFDVVTGDVSGWWDHSFSSKPAKFYLEPKVGGGFMEIFDDTGNGVRHAVVTYVDRPKMIRFEGPLGLAGNALQMVFTYKLEPVGADSTRLTLEAQGAGHVEPGWPALVEKVWHHFLFERLQPYVEWGKHEVKK